MSHPRLVTCLLMLSLAPTAWGQIPAEKALSTFTVPDGMELTQFAAEPLFSNPTCIDIDHKGRVWVCESVNYRCKLRNRPLNRAEGDRIVILEDTDGDGKADKATTFYQAPDFLAPLGILVAKAPTGPGYKVYVCHSPDILLFEDADGDGKADGPPKKLLSGFKGYDHDHGVHGICLGPDGRLYFSVGDQGVDGLVDRDGKRWKTNQTDCQAGTVWRCDLDGKNLELIAHNFRNPYEPCVDSYGNIFISDNDDDGNQQTRICYVMPGSNYGYWPRGQGQSHWHEEQPGVTPKILRTYFGSPTGMCIYDGDLLPAKYRGQALHTDAGPRHLRCYQMKPAGAGFDVVREDMVTSTDNWFRPSDVCVAPDGSVFVADWYDPGVGGHGMGDTSRGRIYRLAPIGHRYMVAPKDVGTPEGLKASLVSPCQADRYRAIAHLSNMPATTRADLAKVMAFHSAVESSRALMALSNIDRSEASIARRQAQETIARSTDPEQRMHARRMLGEKDYSLLPGITGNNALDLPSPASLAEARDLAVRLRVMAPSRAIPLFYALAALHDGKDRIYLSALGVALGQDSGRRQALLEPFEQRFPSWNDKVASLVWELRPPSMLPKVREKLRDKSVPLPQRLQMVDIVAAEPGTSGGEQLLELLAAPQPKELREKILEHMNLFLPGKWSVLRQAEGLKRAVHSLVKQPEGKETGFKLIAAAGLTGMGRNIFEVANNNKENHEIRAAAIAALGQLRSDEVTDLLVALMQNAPPELRIRVVQALGQQAFAGNRKDKASPAIGVLEGLVKSQAEDINLRKAAAVSLASTQSGTQWLIDLHAKQQLAPELVGAVASMLRNSPYQGLRNRALMIFPVPSKMDLKNLPNLTVLASRAGDAGRGKQLWLASATNEAQCMKCHTALGAGGQIGPDLSKIGSKASRESLFESILYPNRAIADQYVTWVVETNGGLILTGLLMEDTPTKLVIRDATGKDTSIVKSEIASRAKSPNSVMPAEIVGYLKEEDLVDLVEYLLTLK